MRDGTALKTGDELRPAWGTPQPRARVDDVTTNYVKLVWGPSSATNGDMVRKDSPLWQLLEPVT